MEVWFAPSRLPKIVRLEAEGSTVQTRPGSSQYFAPVYRIDDDGQRRVFADAYGSTVEEAMANSFAIAETLNATFQKSF